jgi:hypothetical protein
LSVDIGCTNLFFYSGNFCNNSQGSGRTDKSKEEVGPNKL